jgi:hypothetical protein
MACIRKRRGKWVADRMPWRSESCVYPGAVWTASTRRAAPILE